jgi:Kef-type K+ transport system membrane component KefB
LVEFCTDVTISITRIIRITPDTGKFMNRSSPRGIKLTTVIFAVIVLAVSAALSNVSMAGDKEVTVKQSVSEP